MKYIFIVFSAAITLLLASSAAYAQSPTCSWVGDTMTCEGQIDVYGESMTFPLYPDGDASTTYTWITYSGTCGPVDFGWVESPPDGGGLVYIETDPNGVFLGASDICLNWEDTHPTALVSFVARADAPPQPPSQPSGCSDEVQISNASWCNLTQFATDSYTLSGAAVVVFLLSAAAMVITFISGSIRGAR